MHAASFGYQLISLLWREANFAAPSGEFPTLFFVVIDDESMHASFSAVCELQTFASSPPSCYTVKKVHIA